MSEPAKRILVLCPTARDRVHLSRPEIRKAYPLEFRGTDEATHEPGFDAVRFVEGTIRAVKRRRSAYRAIVGLDDFPASMMAALVAEAVGLPAPSFESLFLCQHKYYSRLRQQEAVPEATPRFHVLDLSRDVTASDLSMPFPVFVKPVKSYLSILARPIATLPDLAAVVEEARRRLAGIAAMFDGLVAVSRLDRSLRAVPGAALLAEDLLRGHQVTLDGYAFNGDVVPLGVVDSFFFLRSSSFERFEYPSRLPAPVQERMARLAERCVRAVGLDRTFFNIEFFYREEDDAIHLIEVNGRLSSQFAPLYRMVDGIDVYAMQLEMALGREPGGRQVWGPGRRRDRVAASFVLRTFEDGLVRRVPAPEEVARLASRFPEAFVEILVREGAKLSDELQDDESYRYALVDLCAKDRKELRKKFDDAKGLLPFAFDAIPLAR